MAKNSTRVSFTKAKIVKDEDTGNLIIIEKDKKHYAEYNLTEVLEKYIGVDGISLNLASDSEVEEIV